MKLNFFLKFLIQAIRVYKRNQLIRLSEYVRTDKGFFGHNYVRVYDQILSHLKEDKIALLEIGLLHPDIQKKEGKSVFNDTPSLWLWSQYFKKASIVGFDLQSFEPSRDERIKIIQGDQSNREDLARIIAVSPDFEVIIDDGLHTSQHQQITFSYLFQYLKPGGIFVIEDLHFQPDNYEDTSIPKTVDLLYQLLHTGKWNSPVSLDNEKISIEENIDRILFFDSLKRNVRSEGRDAIAVIYKKK